MLDKSGLIVQISPQYLSLDLNIFGPVKEHFKLRPGTDCGEHN